MTTIRIGRRRYKVPICWEDITLSQCTWLYQRAAALPDELRAYYLAFAEGTEPAIPGDASGLAAFSLEVLGHLASIPQDVMERTCTDDLLALAGAVLPRFLCGIMGHVDYAVQGHRSFRWRGRHYYYPRSGADVMGTPTALSELTAVEFCQLSDIVVTGNMALSPLALALVCRPRREAYDEAKVQRRAQVFSSLPASTYWELWERVSSAHRYLQEAFPACYGKGGKKEEDAPEGGWLDTLVALSVGRPSDLTYLQRMNCYDFVHLLSEHIKRKTEEWKMTAALSAFGVK